MNSYGWPSFPGKNGNKEVICVDHANCNRGGYLSPLDQIRDSLVPVKICGKDLVWDDIDSEVPTPGCATRSVIFLNSPPTNTESLEGLKRLAKDLPDIGACKATWVERARIAQEEKAESEAAQSQ